MHTAVVVCRAFVVVWMCFGSTGTIDEAYVEVGSCYVAALSVRMAEAFTPKAIK